MGFAALLVRVETDAEISVLMQEAEEYRRRKAQQVRENGSHEAAGTDPPKRASHRPMHSPGRTPWWPGEHVIGGGPWSRLPRWRTEDSLGSSSRPSTADSDQSTPKQTRSRHVGASPEQSSQAMTNARLTQPAAGSPSRLSLRPGPQAPRQQHRSMHQARKNLPQAMGDSAQRETTERPHSAPEVSTAQEDSLAHPEEKLHAASGLSTPAGNHTMTSLQPKAHLRRPANSRAPSGRWPMPMCDREAEAHEPERVVYMQRPHAQDLPRRPGSVPDFGKLHSAWSARLTAAKAAMQRRLTVPQVHSLRPQQLGFLLLGCGLQGSWTSLAK